MKESTSNPLYFLAIREENNPKKFTGRDKVPTLEKCHLDKSPPSKCSLLKGAPSKNVEKCRVGWGGGRLFNNLSP